MSSTLDPDNFPQGSRRDGALKGHDTRSLGPSDSSDSGSDLAGPGIIEDGGLGLDRGADPDSDSGGRGVENTSAADGDRGLDSDTDRYGTGEHSSAGREPRFRPDADLDTDRVVDASEAGLGGGLDQAEEAILGKTDEQIAAETAASSGDDGC